MRDVLLFGFGALFSLGQLLWGWRCEQVWGNYRMVSRKQQPLLFRLAMVFWGIMAFGCAIGALSVPIPTHAVNIDLPAPQR